ncbi:lipid II:glycine glycyltransferase FemX [Patescibacteria group bacterium]
MKRHIVQTPEWADVKREYGTPAESAGGVMYTRHKIPGSSFYYAYSPRVSPTEINFEELKESLIKNKCAAINFDVPNVTYEAPEAPDAVSILSKKCVESKRSEFAKANVMLDISKPEKELFSGMYKKHRYNVRQALKHGVEVRVGEKDEDFDAFFDLFEKTAKRQKYFIRPKKYYEIIWKKLHPKGICHILTAYYKNVVVASWMVFIYDEVLYYPYGGSSLDYKNLQASTLLGWEVIKFGKSKGCTLFDMWGAAEDLENKRDPYQGFTIFKLRFGGKYVKYIPSHDFVVNKFWYFVFNFANSIRWKILPLFK